MQWQDAQPLPPACRRCEPLGRRQHPHQPRDLRGSWEEHQHRTPRGRLLPLQVLGRLGPVREEGGGAIALLLDHQVAHEVHEGVIVDLWEERRMKGGRTSRNAHREVIGLLTTGPTTVN